MKKFAKHYMLAVFYGSSNFTIIYSILVFIDSLILFCKIHFKFEVFIKGLIIHFEILIFK